MSAFRYAWLAGMLAAAAAWAQDPAGARSCARR